ncbi:hypothetical protein [Bifidobacterium phasiani]|uniref:Uncharacterized protein n=1 Tax=Bifidobacterium phasiani TaxID=2834431 RepID=A0ABS6W8T7_9BIFI|nr:hypothetical protein [Bifidobacterium phasiani]MBW3082914.1 hypothetical protein [Bifidobacterium phasiani]
MADDDVRRRATMRTTSWRHAAMLRDSHLSAEQLPESFHPTSLAYGEAIRICRHPSYQPLGGTPYASVFRASVLSLGIPIAPHAPVDFRPSASAKNDEAQCSRKNDARKREFDGD